MRTMVTDFDRVPEEFVHRYMSDIREWALTFSSAGNRKAIFLRGPTHGVPDRYEDLGGAPSMVAVVLVAEREGGRMVVRPADEVSSDLIRRHVEAMRN